MIMGAGAIEAKAGEAAGGTAIVKLAAPEIGIAGLVTASLVKTGGGKIAEIEAATMTIEVLGVRVLILVTRALGGVTTEIAADGLATRVQIAEIVATVETAIANVTQDVQTVQAGVAIRKPVIVTEAEIVAAKADGRAAMIGGVRTIAGAVGVPVIAETTGGTTGAPNELVSGSGVVVTVIPMGAAGRAREAGIATMAAATMAAVMTAADAAAVDGAARAPTTMSRGA